MKRANQRWLAIMVTLSMVVQSVWYFTGASHVAAASACPAKSGNLATNVVISQFYGGKKDDSASLYANDFVELFNPTATPVSLAGWSFQFADSGKNNWSKVDLGSPTLQIPAYGYYLVALGTNGAVGTGKELPSPDASGTFKLNNNIGKLVILKTNQTLSAKDPMADVISPDVVDFVGYDPLVDASCGTPAKQAGKSNTMQRLVFDPLNPSTFTTAISFPDRGNNWDTRNNSVDFEKVSTGKPRNSSSTAAYAIVENDQSVEMASATEVNPNKNKIILKAINGFVKQGPWTAGDFAVNGLPAGLTATAIGSNDQIQILIGGNAASDVTDKPILTFSIGTSAWNQSNKPTLPVSVWQGTREVSLTKFTPTYKIIGAADPAASTIRMSDAKTLKATFGIKLSSGIPFNDTLDPASYGITGLPAGSWTISAKGDSSNRTITFAITGTSNAAVTDVVALSAVVKSTAVQNEGWLDSDPIGGISLLRFGSSILTGADRKAAVEQSIVEDNTFFNDPATKAYKYGSDAMGANAFTFFRGTHALFQSDLLSGLIPSPDSAIPEWKDIWTYTQGDAHIQNVGTFNDNKGTMVFDLNDVDSAGIGSFYEDLLRLTASIYAVKYDKSSTSIANLPESDYRDVAKTFLDTYKSTVMAIADDSSKKTTKLTKSNVTSYTKSVMDKVSTATYDSALQKLLGKRALNGKLNIDGNSDKYEAASQAEIDAINAKWEAYKAQVRSQFTNLNDAQFDAYFKIKDIARRIHQGIGSIGVQRYNVLIEGPSAANTDDILLDVKEQLRDANLPKDAYLHMSMDVDAYLGVIETPKRSFLVREYSPYKGDYTDKAFTSKTDFAQYLTDAGKAYAYAHSRLDQVSDVFNYKFEQRFVTDIAPIWNELEVFILNASEDYSHQVAEDFKLVQDDLLAGKLVDVATLDNISLSSGTLSPSFSPDQTNYSVAVGHTTDAIDITALATDAKATMTLQGSDYTSGSSRSIALSDGNNVITLVVTAQNGLTTTYTVTVNRAAAPIASGDTSLSALTLSAGTLSPIFDPATTAYTAQVDDALTSVTVTASASHNKAVVKVNGTVTASGQPSGSIGLNVGGNTIDIVVTAENGSTKTYTVTVNRAAPPILSGDASLSALTLSAGTLSPVFAPATTAYTAQVDNAVTSVTVTASVPDNKKVVKVNGTLTPSGQPSGAISLNEGNNTISIEVTAENGDVGNYRVTVFRAAAPIASGDASLSALTLSAGALSPVFTPATTAYSMQVGNAVKSVTVTASVANNKAIVKVNGTLTASGQASGAITLNEGRNEITLVVTAENGSDNTYTVTVMRQKVVTAGSGTPIAIADEPVTITVPSTVTDAQIATVPVTVGGQKEVVTPLIEVQLTTSLGQIGLTIPAGTKITAPAGWDGIIELPKALSAGSVSMSNANVNAVIQAGWTNGTLIFDHAVRMQLPGQAGKSVGYEKNGAVVPITGTVSLDTQAAADLEIAPGGEAKITSGSDLVVWTKHFTKFAVYTPVVPSNSSNSGVVVAPNPNMITGASGGTVTLNGVRVEAPANATTGTFTVNVSKISDISSLLQGQSGILISDAYEIKKDPVGDFDKPVRITLPYDKTKLDWTKYSIGLYGLNEQTHQWVVLDNQQINTDNGEATGTSSRFGKFAVLASEKQTAVQPPVQTEDQAADIADIKGHWSESSIQALVKLGAISGYPDHSFKPDTRITRAEFVAIIVKAFKLSAPNGKSFGDTKTHWAHGDIAIASALGIVTGYNGDTFGPDDYITREQAAAIVVRAAGIANANGGLGFKDSAAISAWARSPLAAAAANGLINGYQDGTVKPQANTTRAEAAVMVLRALQLGRS